MLAKKWRLRSPEVALVLKNGRGRRDGGTTIKVLAAPTPTEPSRFAVTVPARVVKRAVDRHKLKRQAMTLIEAQLSKFKPGYWVVLIVSTPPHEIHFQHFLL